MHYRLDQLVDIPFRIRVRRLFGDTHRGDLVGWVEVSLLAQETGMVISSAVSRPTLDGVWDEWLDLHVDYSELNMHCQVMVAYNQSTASVGIQEHAYMRQGLCKLLLRGPQSSSRTLDYDKIVKKVEEKRWSRIEWLDEISFASIAREQMEEALSNNQLFLLIEFPKFDAKVKLKSVVEQIADCESRSAIFRDNMIKPYKNMPPPLPHTIIRPSPRSLPVLRRLKRAAIVQPLQPIIPGILWKYRAWLCSPGCQDFERDWEKERLMCHFIKSADWIDGEEVSIVKNCIGQVLLRDSFSLLISVLSLALHFPHLVIFDLELSELLFRSLNSLSSNLHIYTVCTFIRNSEWKQFTQLHKLLHSLLNKATEECLYGAMAVYWMLEREDLIRRPDWREIVGKQRMIIDCLQSLINKVRGGKQSRLEKKEKLCALLRDPPDQCPPLLAPFLSPSVPLPTNPDVRVSGVIPEHSTVYKSSAMPVKISFLGEHDCQEHAVIIKTGESLEADLMVMRAIDLMDQLWKENNINLYIITYSVLPVPHQNGGWLQFIPSSSLSAILADNGNSLLPYLMTTQNIERYIYSCAGYCIISYILGIGDRHLENLLLSPDGCMFHVDFAYLFGADPKPFPPPMKLCREMVEAMGGGMESSDFKKFKELTLQGFQILRLHAGLIVDFLALHNNLVGEEEILFVRNRLAIDKSDSEALGLMERLLEESVHAMFPQVLETIHKWSQYWKS